MTPEEAMAVERRLERDAVESMQEYAGMKAQLLGRAQRGAGFLSIYIFLQQGLVVSLPAGATLLPLSWLWSGGGGVSCLCTSSSSRA